jgi:hypothetical protein
MPTYARENFDVALPRSGYQAAVVFDHAAQAWAVYVRLAGACQWHRSGHVGRPGLCQDEVSALARASAVSAIDAGEVKAE